MDKGDKRQRGSHSMKLDQALHSELLGFFSPGAPMAVNPTPGMHVAATTHLHEGIHYSVTQGSSLGTVAMLCGLVKIYDTDPKARSSAEKYLRAFCTKSSWLQEGAATASELIFAALAERSSVRWISRDDIVSGRPLSYIKAADDVFSIAGPLCKCFQWSYPSNHYAALMSAASGVAAAAMNPNISEDFIRAALSGDVSGYIEPLSSIWTRFKRIRRCSLDQVAKSIANTFRDKPTRQSDTYLLIQFKRDVSEAICSVAGIDHAERINGKELAEQFLPHLSEKISVIDARNLSLSEMRQMAEHIGQQLFFPEKINGTRLRMTDLESLHHIKNNGPTIVEVTAFENGSVGFFLHFFDDDNNSTYLGSATLEYGNADPRTVLDTLLTEFSTNIDSEVSGVVVGRETVRDHISKLMEGVPRVALPLFNIGPKKISELTYIAQRDGVALQRLDLRNGEVIWQLSVAHPGECGRQMTAHEYAYSWVLRSGMAARMRWENQYGPSELSRK